MIRSMLGQRIVGGMMAITCGFWFVSAWRTLIDLGSYDRELSALLPAMGIAGVGLLFFPFDYEELRQDYGVEKFEHFSQMPTFWKLWFCIALVAGLGNWYAMAHFR